jgi:hypothetical protein
VVVAVPAALLSLVSLAWQLIQRRAAHSVGGVSRAAVAIMSRVDGRCVYTLSYKHPIDWLEAF